MQNMNIISFERVIDQKGNITSVKLLKMT
jgi:hypothetical protein